VTPQDDDDNGAAPDGAPPTGGARNEPGAYVVQVGDSRRTGIDGPAPDGTVDA
jgi:hypothetical protein